MQVIKPLMINNAYVNAVLNPLIESYNMRAESRAWQQKFSTKSCAQKRLDIRDHFYWHGLT